MTRLTSGMRETLLDKLLEHRFKDEASEQVVLFKRFADLVYNDLYPKNIQTAMMKLASGWLSESDDFHVQFGAQNRYASLDFNGRQGLPRDIFRLTTYVDVKDRVRRRFPAKDHGKTITVYSEDHALSVQYEALLTTAKELNEVIAQARRETFAALKQATTIKSLLAKWPELEPFIVVKKKIQLPALPTEHLNSILGLPVGA